MAAFPKYFISTNWSVLRQATRRWGDKRRNQKLQVWRLPEVTHRMINENEFCRDLWHEAPALVTTPCSSPTGSKQWLFMPISSLAFFGARFLQLGKITQVSDSDLCLATPHAFARWMQASMFLFICGPMSVRVTLLMWFDFIWKRLALHN